RALEPNRYRASSRPWVRVCRSAAERLHSTALRAVSWEKPKRKRLTTAERELTSVAANSRTSRILSAVARRPEPDPGGALARATVARARTVWGVIVEWSWRMGDSLLARLLGRIELRNPHASRHSPPSQV